MRKFVVNYKVFLSFILSIIVLISTLIVLSNFSGDFLIKFGFINDDSKINKNERAHDLYHLLLQMIHVFHECHKGKFFNFKDAYHANDVLEEIYNKKVFIHERMRNIHKSIDKFDGITNERILELLSVLNELLNNYERLAEIIEIPGNSERLILKNRSERVGILFLVVEKILSIIINLNERIVSGEKFYIHKTNKISLLKLIEQLYPEEVRYYQDMLEKKNNLNEDQFIELYTKRPFNTPMVIHMFARSVNEI